MARQAQIVMGSQESYEGLKESAQENGAYWWSCGKDTKKGALLFFYFKKPKSEIVATATASSDAMPHKKWHFGADIKDVKILERPITLEKMRKAFPNWGWLKQTRNQTYLDEPTTAKLLKLANLKKKLPTEPTVTISRGGAGFGTAKQNREVEQAACKAVQMHFKKKGYAVVSREKEKIGYDFDAWRKGYELHIEVKGISGSYLRFPITANEIGCAKSDSKFRLAVVTQAKSPQKKVRVISRKDFLKHFQFKPLAFFAQAKSSLSA